ncbi:MAG: trimethylamine methyltransferase family protein [Armatimonadota bacterium]
MKLPTMTVLSDGEVKQIHEASLHILETCGIKVHSLKMLEFLKGKGLAVDVEQRLVRFSRSSIEDAMSTIPATFDVFDREGEFAYTLGDGVPKIAAGHNAVFWLDSETGETRSSTVSDVEQFARICEKLANIDMIGIPVMPQDIPQAEASLLYGVRACIENSKKPIYFSTDKVDVNRACMELLRAAFAGDFDSQVYGISQLSPTSPLYWEGTVIDAIMDTVDTGVPLAILPEPNAGISAPYTLAGLLTVNNVECISGLAMIQMLKPGHKVMYANSWTTTDMRSGAALVGSVETTLCRIAAAQLARFYKAPSHTTAPNSDNHAHDEQNAWEKTLSQFCAVSAGHDLIVNCGMFATGMTCSHEQLVMDEEISAMSRRIAAGITVNEDTIAWDVVEEIGPQGETYLMAEHTMDWLRSDEYHIPKIAVRGPRASWEAAGSKDTYQVAQDAVANLASQKAPALDDARKAKLNDIVQGFQPERRA